MSTTADRILVGVDGSENSKNALRVAAELSQALGAPLQAVMCWDSPYLYESYSTIDPAKFAAEAEELFAATLTDVFGEHLPDNLTPQLIRGQATEQLIEESKTARLLVVGRRGLGGVLGAVLGSVSSALVSHAHCAVLVART